MMLADKGITELNLADAVQDFAGDVLASISSMPLVQQALDTTAEYDDLPADDATTDDAAADDQNEDDSGDDGDDDDSQRQRWKNKKGGFGSWFGEDDDGMGGKARMSTPLGLPNLLQDIAAALVFGLQITMLLVNLLTNGTTLVSGIPFYVFALFPIASVFLKVWGEDRINRFYRGGTISLVIGAVISAVLSGVAVVSDALFFGLGGFYLSQGQTGAPSVFEIILGIVAMIGWIAYGGFEGFYAYSAFSFDRGEGFDFSDLQDRKGDRGERGSFGRFTDDDDQ